MCFSHATDITAEEENGKKNCDARYQPQLIALIGGGSALCANLANTMDERQIT